MSGVLVARSIRPQWGSSDARDAVRPRLLYHRDMLFRQLIDNETSTFTYLLDKLKATQDGDGTLLDHSMVLYGSAMSDGNQHNHDPLPLILAGSASGQLKGGRHLRNKTNTTMSNLLVAMSEKMGVPMEKFGDSTGVLEI